MTLREIVEFSLFTINGVNFTVTHLLSIVLIIGLTRLINVLVKVFLRRSQKKRKWLDSGKEYALSQIIKYIVYTIALVLILQTLGIDVTILIASSAARFLSESVWAYKMCLETLYLASSSSLSAALKLATSLKWRGLLDK